MSEGHLWFLILIALFAWPATTYLVRHFRSEASAIDVNSLEQDLSWQSDKKLWLSVATLGALVGLAAYSFTTPASEFARSQLFMILLFICLARFGAFSVVQGVRTGSIEPAIKGDFGPYSRFEHPTRYLLSLAWNALLTGLMMWFTWMAWNGDI